MRRTALVLAFSVAAAVAMTAQQPAAPAASAQSLKTFAASATRPMY